MRSIFTLQVLIFCLAATSCSAQTGPVENAAPLKITLLATHPHDARSFTQGLVYENGELYESSGKYGESSLRRVEITTGKVLQKIALNQKYFAEGIAIVGDKIFQLTWRENACFLYEKETFAWQKSFPYKGEGWGITWDGEKLIVSDGSDMLKFYDPETFQLQRTLLVKNGQKSVDLINELEYINGEIWANILYSNSIARISPQNGQILGWIDMSNFVPKEIKNLQDRERALNGIAFDEEKQRVYITGKYWPVLYEFQIIPNATKQ